MVASDDSIVQLSSSTPSNSILIKIEANRDTDKTNEAHKNCESELKDTDEATVLKDLTEDVRDQDDLERDITHQANLIMIEHEDELDRKRLEKIKLSIEKLEAQKRTHKRRLDATANSVGAQDRNIREIERIDDEILALKNDISDIQGRIEERHPRNHAEPSNNCVDSNQRMPDESEKEFLIRTGKITPFFRISGEPSEQIDKNVSEDVLDQAQHIEIQDSRVSEASTKSHQNLRLPGFIATASEEEFSLRPRKKRRLHDSLSFSEALENPSLNKDILSPSFENHDKDNDELSNFEDSNDVTSRSSKSSKKRAATKVKEVDKIDLTGIDDGNESLYQNRLRSWVKRRRAARNHEKLDSNHMTDIQKVPDDNNDNQEKEWYKPCPDISDHIFDNGLRIPGDIHPALFDYQKTGIQWLGELYSQEVGGILGDEMGLGKTIQIISFLAGLHYSKKLVKPIIVIAPATVLRQWVNEFHKWWPPMRVSILHSSGSGMMALRSEDRLDDSQKLYGASDKKKSSKRVKNIVDRVIRQGHVLVTTYAGLQTYADTLLPVDWGYAVLDEGHKIRNPNTAVTIYCKELKTPHRIILSGTPMQNNLVELWSLFDFIFPMRLGTLVSFRQTFETPIKQGGYSNSTNLQILTATKCAEELKTVISPYLLQRMKVDVASDLPKKTEQVLFVKLTRPQREAYQAFLASEDVSSIMKGTRQSLYGIDILKKICNHPDLIDPGLKNKPYYKWADPKKSGKMKIVESLLNLWKGFNHKTLLFCQGVQMLEILENFIRDLGSFNYLRMDGSTNIKDRQTMVDQFNSSPDIHVFLLTTKVGGLGVNLTGANRVLIFDPDWNPSTDIQARERAWRLGQKKEVTIYRLITAGTIEEKMYHRQIFKQFLSNKVLKDPKQRQTFQMKDIYDLFTLGSNEDNTTETGQMFKGTEVKFHVDTKSSESGEISENPSYPTRMSLEKQDCISEVRNMSGIAGLEDFVNNADEENKRMVSEEDRLMKGIFSGSDIQIALEHDQIVDGKRIITADRGILEREAKRVASKAAAELIKAAEVARNLTPGTVTWTGDFGSAGRPDDPHKTNSSYRRSMNGAICGKDMVATDSGSSSRMRTREGVFRVRGEDFRKTIPSFIKRHGGSVPSQALIKNFNRICQTPQQTSEFKKVLGEVARLEFSKSNQTRGKWYLKDEFR
ncbi:DNA repair protein rhp26 [Golovinomyces cichoracearum]|uniref:DNA repair protein rhp26 n=1 Tax=Golovinomyces cichoracearum TaxID=62708 RepID=A0A420IFQ5_9PEZI|nr:DNA repair protein rhp26 [Golovinomyces cichoracearum]